MGGDEQGKSIHCFVRFYRNKSIAYKSIKNITKMIRFFWEKRLILTKTKPEPNERCSALVLYYRGKDAKSEIKDCNGCILNTMNWTRILQAASKENHFPRADDQ